MAEDLGVEVEGEEAEEVVRVRLKVRIKAVRVKAVREVRAQVKGGPTSRRVLIILLQASVKNIMSMGSQLTGVKNQLHVRGRTSGSRRASNETVTNLIFMTYKTLCIKASRNKYIQPLT